MPTKYLQSNQSLSTATWYDAASGGSVTTAPGDGDVLDLNGFVLTMNQTRLPATGTLSEIKSSTNSGNIALALNTVGSSSIYCTTIRGTTSTSLVGAITITGTTSNTLTIYGNLVGGTFANSYPVYYNGTGPLIVNGDITAGSGSASYGLYNRTCLSITVNGNITGGGTTTTNANVYGLYDYPANSVITVTGNVTGGGASGGSGIYKRTTGGSITVTGNVTGGNYNPSYGIHNASTGSITIINGTITDGNGVGQRYGVFNASSGNLILNNCNIVNLSGSAIGGYGPTSMTNTSAMYIQMKTGAGTTAKFGIIPAAGNIKAGVVCGDVTGTRVDALVNKVTKDYTYGDPGDQLTGTRTDAPENKVESGYNYGDPGDQFTGSLSVSSGTPNFLKPYSIRGK